MFRSVTYSAHTDGLVSLGDSAHASGWFDPHHNNAGVLYQMFRPTGEQELKVAEI